MEHPDGPDSWKGGWGRVGEPGWPGVQDMPDPESHGSENHATGKLELEHLVTVEGVQLSLIHISEPTRQAS